MPVCTTLGHKMNVADLTGCLIYSVTDVSRGRAENVSGIRPG